LLPRAHTARPLSPARAHRAGAGRHLDRPPLPGPAAANWTARRELDRPQAAT